MTDRPGTRVFERVSEDAVKALEPHVSRILDILGHADAYATDESRISHYLNIFARPTRWRRGRTGPWQHCPADPEAQRENEETLRRLREELRVPVEPADLVVDVARRVRALGRA